MEKIGQESLCELERKLAQLCAKEETIIAAYLFGSQGKGCPMPSSDVDLAVLLDERRTMDFSLLSFAVLVERATGRRADVVVLNRAGELLKREVRRTGVVIFERDAAARKRFEIMGRRTYEDFLHLHQKHIRKILSKERSPNG